MSETRCTDSNCTYVQTGLCVLNNDPEECPNLVSGQELETDDDTVLADSVVGFAGDSQRFPRSDVLLLDDVRVLMRKEYCHVVGLIGVPDSGKTACLVSCYLLLSCNRMERFMFADSRSLMALDELSRGARRWSKSVPDQMTAHTRLEDGRSPGFLHFKLVRRSDGVRQHLVITDLPGEWATDLIEKNRVDRLSFLRAADVIWLMVDGQTLSNREQRQGAISRTSLLIDRIAGFLSPAIPAIRLVVSRLDLGKPPDDALQQLHSRARRHNIELSVSHVASFSKSEETKAGEGIEDLISHTISQPAVDCEFWPMDHEAGPATRGPVMFAQGDSRD